MAGWHHWLNGRESERAPGDGDGQGGLVCCDSWGRKESDTTEWLNWTELIPSLRGWILSSFWFLPTKGWSSGLCELHIGWDLCWVFVCLLACLFFLWWARLSEVVILSADDWVCIFVLFVVWMRHPAQGATGEFVDARSCIQVASFVWVLTIWYSLGLALW